jgi:hypothetical protein
MNSASADRARNDDYFLTRPPPRRRSPARVGAAGRADRNFVGGERAYSNDSLRDRQARFLRGWIPLSEAASRVVARLYFGEVAE